MHVDTAIQQYESVAALRRPTDQQRQMVQLFIRSKALGGNCQFLGRDLADEPPFMSVFDRNNRRDLVFLGEDNGEDDSFSRLVTGPGLRLFHWIWKHFKVGVL